MERFAPLYCSGQRTEKPHLTGLELRDQHVGNAAGLSKGFLECPLPGRFLTPGPFLPCPHVRLEFRVCHRGAPSLQHPAALGLIVPEPPVPASTPAGAPPRSSAAVSPRASLRSAAVQSAPVRSQLRDRLSESVPAHPPVCRAPPAFRRGGPARSGHPCPHLPTIPATTTRSTSKVNGRSSRRPFGTRSTFSSSTATRTPAPARQASSAMSPAPPRHGRPGPGHAGGSAAATAPAPQCRPRPVGDPGVPTWTPPAPEWCSPRGRSPPPAGRRNP